MNSPRLRPYHNPENVDGSRVPAGWRFLYEGEKPDKSRPHKVWMEFGFSISLCRRFRNNSWTHIVPVA